MFDVHRLSKIEFEDRNDTVVGEYCQELFDEFMASPEGKAIDEQHSQTGWVVTFLDLSLNYPGVAPPEMSYWDVAEVLFELFPRKVSTEPENATEIIAELRAFFAFLHRAYGLANAQQILQELGDEATSQLEGEMGDPSNYGMAKSVFMAGLESGFDMTTEAGIAQFMAAYNASIDASHEAQQKASGATRRRDEPAVSPVAPQSRAKPWFAILSRKERKSREKLRRKKLGKSAKRRR